MYPNHALPQRPIVTSNNLVKKNFGCSKKSRKDTKQESKYLQSRWCPSGLSHTQKRRLQRMRKKESMEQQAEVVPVRSATMKHVWRPKQAVLSSAWKRSKIRPIEFIALRIKYGRCMFIIVLRQFWSKCLFFGITKKQEGHMLTAKIGTGWIDRSDRSMRAVWPIWTV